MYHKCYISKNLIYNDQDKISNQSIDPKMSNRSIDPKMSNQSIDPNIGSYSVNIYYTKNNLPTQCPTGESSENVIIGDIKNILIQYENKNKNKCVITYGSPTSYDYEKIKTLTTT
jgi:hypothetical protein